jgi:hypothetical protein
MNDFAMMSQAQKAWFIECFECTPEYFHYTSAECCDNFPEELCHLEEIAELDDSFEDRLEEWDYFVQKNNLYVLLEQSCEGGVMLSKEIVHARVVDSPKDQLVPFRTLMNQCPEHVLAVLAQRYFLVVRMERAERLGKATWNPNEGSVSSPFFEIFYDKTNWKQASFKARKYSGS